LLRAVGPLHIVAGQMGLKTAVASENMPMICE